MIIVASLILGLALIAASNDVLMGLRAIAKALEKK